MIKNYPRFLTTVFATLLLVGVWGSSHAQGTPPPAGLDFSVLSVSDPQEALSLTAGYKGSLGTTWQGLHNNPAAKWMAPYSDDHFKLSPNSFSLGTTSYDAYLVTPALALDKVSGKTLTFNLKIGTLKGASPVEISIIDQSGNTLHKIYSVQHEKHDYMPVEVSIPTGLSGVGFIAFTAHGDKANRTEILVKDIVLTEASSEPSITFNPSSGLHFSEVAVGETGATKEITFFVKNFTGIPEVSLTGINKEDFLLSGVQNVSQTGGTVSVTFVPKNGNPNITAAVSIKAGSAKVDVPLTASATGAVASIKVSASPTSLDFGSVEVGKKSTQKATLVSIQNAIDNPQISVVGSHAGDFIVTPSAQMNNLGGGISVVFAPSASGSRSASIEVNASGTILQIPLTGVGTGTTTPTKPEPTDDMEMLTDQYFYDFNENGAPIHWSISGNVKEGSKLYNSSTGKAIEIDQRGREEIGKIYQTIDIEALPYSMAPGAVVEGTIHYAVQEPFVENGGVRFACRWLDKDKQPINAPEDAFINSGRYMEWRKSYKEARFRAIVPAGAKYFLFCVEVSPGSMVNLDDFSLVRLTKTNGSFAFYSVQPHAIYKEGNIDTPVQGTLLVQSMGLIAPSSPLLNAPSGTTMELSPIKLEKGNNVTEVTYTIQSAKPGIFINGRTGTKPFRIQYNGEEEHASTYINAFFIDPNNKPSVKLADASQNKVLKCVVGKQTDMLLNFDVQGVIDHVNVRIDPAGGAFKVNANQFYYSSSTGNVLNKDVKVTFAPQTAGTHTAKLYFSTPSMQEYEIELRGEAENVPSEWQEKFTEDKKLSDRETGDRWARYHIFDQGYYRLDGSWTEAGKISIDKEGALVCDEVLNNGIETISLTPASASWQVLYTVDGGHWTEAQHQDGVYMIRTHRPTRFKVVNGASATQTLSVIDLTPNKPESRIYFDNNLTAAMAQEEPTTAMKLLSEEFNTLRHRRSIDLPRWQSFATLQDATFLGWDLRKNNFLENPIEETCAQISFYNSLHKDNSNPHEAWLVSPLLSYKQSASKVLTFRLRFRLPTDGGKEQFGVYILTSNSDGKIAAQPLKLEQHLLANEMEAELWYDYYIDLSTVEGLTIEDLFYVAFSMYSPVGGNQTTTTFMIDDVTYGRTDLPEISVDRDLVNFLYKPNINCDPQTIKTSVKNPSQIVTVSLVPGRVSEEFKVSDTSLPKEGGVLSVGFGTKKTDKKDRAAALLLQTRGGRSAMVRLLAQFDTAIESPESLYEINVYPTEVERELQVSAPFRRYLIYTIVGEQVAEGDYATAINVETLPAGRYVIRLLTEDGGYSSHSFYKK